MDSQISSLSKILTLLLIYKLTYVQLFEYKILILIV